MTDAATVPTVEEVQRVHEFECSTGGHHWDFVHVAEQRDPVLIVCSRCSRSLKVIPA